MEKEISKDGEMFVKKSMETYKKSEKETLDNPIVQEVLKSYEKGGCNYRRENK